MIEVTVNFNIVEKFFKRLANRSIEEMVEKIQNSDKFKLLLKRYINENIEKTSSPDGVKYAHLTYKGYGNSIKKNPNNKPLQTLKHVILRNNITSKYNKEKKELTFSFRFNKRDSRRYLIHNHGGNTYNPYSKTEISFIPKREYLGIKKENRRSALREVKRIAST